MDPLLGELKPYVERITAVVQMAGGQVVDVWTEQGVPEVRLEFPEGTSHKIRWEVRKRIIAIQQEVPR